MAYDYGFKKFSHQPRVNFPEESFANGMNYTDTPLKAGLSKMMLNFDISTDGTSLKPRASFRTSEVFYKANKTTFNINKLEYIGDSFVDTSNTNFEKITYAVGSNTNSKEAYIFTKTQKLEQDSFINCDAYNAVVIRGLNKNTNGDIVGTSAWNGSFYYMSESGLAYLKYNETQNEMQSALVTPTQLTALEASPNKFNMLLANPYSFTNSIVAGAFVLNGVLPYLNNALIVSPKINTKYTYKLNYTAPASTKYDVVWEWKDYNGTTWTQIKKETVSISTSAPDISCVFASPIKSSLLRVTVTGYDGNTIKTYPDQVTAISIECDSETQNSALNSELKNYDLSKATGMCYWQNRLVLWGFSSDPIIIASETNLPEWFPYPNNIDLFEEEIIKCIPYLDTLLVFTNKKIHQLTMLSDGSGWSKSCIQDHLQIDSADKEFIQTIKNMVFFKSGNYYYMVVPSATTGLSIAPISTPLHHMLDNFDEVVNETINEVYNYNKGLTFTRSYSYVNNDDLVVNYIYKTELDKNLYINFSLIYDTAERTWRTQVYESQSEYCVYKQSATADSVLATLTQIQIENSVNQPLIQIINRDPNNPKDYYIIEGLFISPDTDEDSQIAFDVTHKFLNYQFLDTGYRNLDYPDTKKRHREFQIRFNNISEEPLLFGTTFLVDGDERKNMYRYEVMHETNPESKSYGLITYEPILVEEELVQGSTILTDLTNDINAWKLDISAFPHIPLVKARIPISGKGYNNRLKILSVNEKNYELLGLCWVYKLMNLR